MKTLRGVLRYGWLNSNLKRKQATFLLFPPKGPGIKLRTQDGKPFAPITWCRPPPLLPSSAGYQLNSQLWIMTSPGPEKSRRGSYRSVH